MYKAIRFYVMFLAVVASSAVMCSCSDDVVEDTHAAGVDASVSVGRSTYSFGSAYWQCYADSTCSADSGSRSAESGSRSADSGLRSAESGSRSADSGFRSAESGSRLAKAGRYRCQLEFFSFDYYRAVAQGKMPGTYSFVVVSFASDTRLEQLSSLRVKAGDWQLSGALDMPRGKGESGYYLQEAANHPNGDLVVEKCDEGYRVAIDPVFMDYERPSDHSWFVIESPFVFVGDVEPVPAKYAASGE